MATDTDSLAALSAQVIPLPETRRKLEEGVTLTTGPTGIGKSTTFEHIAAELRAKGWTRVGETPPRAVTPN